MRCGSLFPGLEGSLPGQPLHANPTAPGAPEVPVSLYPDSFVAPDTLLVAFDEKKSFSLFLSLEHLPSYECIDLCSDGISYSPEEGQALLLGAGYRIGIGKAPVPLLACVREVRTLLGGLITDRDHQIHRWLIGKFLDAFCAMSYGLADVDSQLCHRLYGQWMHGTRMCSRTKHAVSLPATCPQETFCHLRT